MALEGANIIGQAQVYNQTQNAVNQYARTLQQQQLQRERESKALSDELSKVKVDGIRQPDIPEFTTKYQEAKDIFAKRIATRDNAERIKLDLDLKTKMLELNLIAEDSKELARGIRQINNILIDPTKRDGFTDDAVTRIQKSNGLSRNDPNFIRDFTTLEQQVDLSAIMKELDNRDKNIIGQAQWVQSSEAGTQGNRKGVNVFDMRQADPKQQAIEYASFFDTSPKFRNAIRKMYPQFSKLPNDELKAMAIPELVSQRPKVEYGKPNFKEDRDDRALNIAERRENRLASGEGGGGSPVPQNIPVPYADGTASVDANGYIGISIPDKNFVGSPAIDMETGETIKALESSDKYSIVGVGNFPIISSKKFTFNGKNLHNTLSQPSFQEKNPSAITHKPFLHVRKTKPLKSGGTKTFDYLIPYDKMAMNIKNTKAVSDALGNFVPANGQANATQSKPTSGAMSDSDYQKFLKANGL